MRRDVAAFRSLGLVGGLAVFLGLVAGHAAVDAADGAAPGPMNLPTLIRAWSDRSTKLKTLEVNIEREDNSPAWGKESLKGTAKFKSPNLAFVEFSKVDAQGKASPHQRLVCTGTQVCEYKFPTKQIFVYPMDKEAARRSLDEGPLPFLFNFRAQDAMQRYELALLKTPEPSGQGVYIVSVIPRLAPDKEEFSKAFIQLDAKFLLPTKIYQIGSNGKDTKLYTLSGLDANSVNWKADSWFIARQIPGFKVEVRKPDAAGGAIAAPAPAPAPRAAGRTQRATPAR